jgi:hypothetical protein
MHQGGIAWVVLAASHAHLNDFAAAKAALSGLQEVLPDQRISTLPFPPFGEQQAVLLQDGLRMAGLPE